MNFYSSTTRRDVHIFVHIYLEFPVENVVPVQSFKPPVTFDIVGSILFKN